jgi:hypothetical protein
MTDDKPQPKPDEIERCDSCGATDFAVVRDMTSKRKCHCGNEWPCPPKPAPRPDTSQTKAILATSAGECEKSRDFQGERPSTYKVTNSAEKSTYKVTDRPDEPQAREWLLFGSCDPADYDGKTLCNYAHILKCREEVRVIEYAAYKRVCDERDELRFEFEAKQRPLGEQVLALTLERDAKAKECEALEGHLKNQIEHNMKMTEARDAALSEVERLKDVIRDLDTDCHGAEMYAADLKEERDELAVENARMREALEMIASLYYSSGDEEHQEIAREALSASRNVADK